MHTLHICALSCKLYFFAHACHKGDVDSEWAQSDATQSLSFIINHFFFYSSFIVI